MTVRHALGSLERRGLVARRVGRGGGTFVAESKLELAGLAALSDQLDALGLTAGARVLSAREVDAGPGALGAGRAYEIVRVRLAENETVALERTWFPADVYPGLLDGPLAGSLYALIRGRYAEVPVRALERLESAVASRGDAEVLGISPGDPLLAVDRTAYGSTGRVLEVGRDLFRGDRVRVVWSTEIS
jgi:GntR family transcriptional regulator